MNFRNGDCVTASVDKVESVDSAVCGKHAVSYFGASFGRIKSLSVYRSTSILTGKILHEHFIPPPEIAAAQRGCEAFSIECKHRACLSTSR